MSRETFATALAKVEVNPGFPADLTAGPAEGRRGAAAGEEDLRHSRLEEGPAARSVGQGGERVRRIPSPFLLAATVTLGNSSVRKIPASKRQTKYQTMPKASRIRSASRDASWSSAVQSAQELVGGGSPAIRKVPQPVPIRRDPAIDIQTSPIHPPLGTQHDWPAHGPRCRSCRILRRARAAEPSLPRLCPLG